MKVTYGSRFEWRLNEGFFESNKFFSIRNAFVSILRKNACFLLFFPKTTAFFLKILPFSRKITQQWDFCEFFATNSLEISRMQSEWKKTNIFKNPSFKRHSKRSPYLASPSVNIFYPFLLCKTFYNHFYFIPQTFSGGQKNWRPERFRSAIKATCTLYFYFFNSFCRRNNYW